MVDKFNLADKRRVALIENLNEKSGWIDILARSCSTLELKQKQQQLIWNKMITGADF